MADATVGAGAELLIWSSLPHITNITNGKLRNVKHFDSKAIVEAYIRGLPIKSAFYMPGHYMQTFVDMWKPKPVWQLTLRDSICIQTRTLADQIRHY